MTNSAQARTPEGMIADIMARLSALENRIPAQPDRIGPMGKRVTDWNQAMEAGFYWSDNAALNRPAGATWVTGVVTVNLMPTFERVQQQLMVPSAGNQTVTYRRVGFSPTYTDGKITGWSWSAWIADGKGYNDFQPFMPDGNGVVFSNSWGNNITSPWGGVYVSRIGGFVHIAGGAGKASGWAAGEEILSLPAGFRSSRSFIGVNCQIMAPSNVNNGNSLQTISSSGSAGNYNFTAIFPAAG